MTVDAPGRREEIMSIQVHFVNPNIEKDTAQVVSDLLVLPALKKLHTVNWEGEGEREYFRTDMAEFGYELVEIYADE